METIKGNKLIAEFMGMKSMLVSEYENYEGSDRSSVHFADHYQNYHSSWDWLIPVVEKITYELQFRYAGHKLNEADAMEWYKWKRYFQKEKNTCKLITATEGVQLLTSSNIYRVYSFVVGFIQWYNENK